MGQFHDRDMLFLLHDVARLIRVEADKRARLQGMTRAQWALLLKLERNPGLSQKEIADLLEVEPISVARLVDRLAARGLLERRPDAEDRRVWRLHLTAQADGMLAEIHKQLEVLGAELDEGVTAPMRSTMVQVLLMMKANLLRAEPAGRLREVA